MNGLKKHLLAVAAALALVATLAVPGLAPAAGNKTDYLENLVLKWAFTTNSVTRPTAWYMALFTAACGETGGGTEVSGSGYARQAFTPGLSGSVISNSGGQVQFTASGGNWGSITYVGVFDASTAGNLMLCGPLTTPRTINDGDVLTFSTGTFGFTED